MTYRPIQLILTCLFALLPALGFTDETNYCLVKEQKPATEPAFLVPLTMGSGGYLTWKPGMRAQVRYALDGENWDHDVMIRRLRFKSSGDMFGLANYYTEIKLDNVGRRGQSLSAAVENVWFDVPVSAGCLYVRAGKMDVPFSRDTLTSDSKLLFMERSLISGALSSLGLADDGIGLMLHGRPWEGCMEYDIGIFDNVNFEVIGSTGTKRSKQLMPAGRLVMHFLDPMTSPAGYGDYKGSYIGKGRRLDVGFNGGYLGSAHDDDDRFNLYALGVDAFFCIERFTLQGEFDWYKQQRRGDDPDNCAYGWFVQAGYLLCDCFELAARYQELEPNTRETEDHKRHTTLGANYYIREHNLKIQTDYTFRCEGDGLTSGLYQLQVQLDF